MLQSSIQYNIEVIGNVIDEFDAQYFTFIGVTMPSFMATLPLTFLSKGFNCSEESYSEDNTIKVLKYVFELHDLKATMNIMINNVDNSTSCEGNMNFDVESSIERHVTLKLNDVEFETTRDLLNELKSQLRQLKEVAKDVPA